MNLCGFFSEFWGETISLTCIGPLVIAHCSVWPRILGHCVGSSNVVKPFVVVVILLHEVGGDMSSS